MVVGDFNSLHPSKKIWGVEDFSKSMAELWKFFLDFGLVDLDLREDNFIWSNRRQGTSLIKVHLDRASLS